MVDSTKKISRYAANLLGILETVHYRRVPFDTQFDPVYRLRYEAYRRENYIAPNSEKVVFDDDDLASNAYCYGIYIKEKLVSSIRFHHVTPSQRTSPSSVVFPDALKTMLDEGHSYIDPSRFTSDYEASLAFPALPILTVRIVAMASVYFEVDNCISSVRKEHAAFYKRMFGSKRLPGVGYYPGFSFPMHLYSIEVSALRKRIARRFPFLLSTRAERESLFGENDGSGTPLLPLSARQAMIEEPE